ncbi:valine--tRNA ligase [Propylenella binzhouense]|uniref:Valine--tRNA ligase n=1 Tax=Propylenella binzhouense TaxID=2555902 RepID=A0A964T3B6_9HYPH|nr:valine--tRNA ligase [Propylenella binzhouense]MYZ47177.1 valine--tRNA ligase [Propylenella binzhouense]
MLDKTYDAASVEPKIRDKWEAAEAFRAGAGAAPGAETFTIVIPPPNVTGSLHMGHALNNTLQDVLVRFARMRGKDVLWQPGMDHAGIATQMVVERQMMERQEPDRRSIGREAFIEKVWAWKAESGGMIVNQLKRLGASCDWSRERFTMDEGLSRAVLKVFVRLYKEGLIYRDKRLVNWDPKLLTAISDLEVQQVEVKGKLWHFRYPLADGRSYRFPTAFDESGRAVEWEERNYIVVATTRPETMLGDTAVAVHPDDERYRGLVGGEVVLPLVGRRIPIVADEYADPEAGSGAVKITPAHDFNDFEVGRRHGLPLVNVFDVEAKVVLRGNSDFLSGVPETDELAETVPALDGQDRFAARERIVAMMEARGLLDRIEDHPHSVPHGDRSGVPIEPFLTDQWYVDAKTLAAPAIASVREGRTDFVPKSWEKTYFEWMENIQPWCISRQLWWGHRIPAWYGPDGEIFVEESEEEAEAAAFRHYETRVKLRRDEDVLDTWFSSALWPFSTLGWPDETPELRRYYPTSVLVTGFDIIFFWVARMMMMGLHFMEEEPFHTVYIHALVRDEHGAKMSKSKGNVVDPLQLIDEYGADALRFTLAAMAAQGRDIKLSTARIAGYRNFATKLWNAARFCEMNGCRPRDDFDPPAALDPLNRWILTETAKAAGRVTEAIEGYRFNEAAEAAYQFVWNTFCDWYLELAKPILAGDDEAAKAELRATAGHVLGTALKLLHPFMPYVTEALWESLHGADRGLLALAPWPDGAYEDSEAADDVNWLIALVSEIRSARSEMNVPPGARIPLVMVGGSPETHDRLSRHAAALERLARLAEIRLGDAVPSGSAQLLIGEATAALPLAGIVDLSAERIRLEKEIAKVRQEIDRLDKKLANENFVARAPEEVVEAEREKRAGYASDQERLEAALKRVREAA